MAVQNEKGAPMEKQLRLIETIHTRGDDGVSYVVRGYEHLARLESAPDLPDQWEATGVFEYRLASGESVQVDRLGAMTVVASGVKLTREPLPATV